MSAQVHTLITILGVGGITFYIQRRVAVFSSIAFRSNILGGTALALKQVTRAVNSAPTRFSSLAVTPPDPILSIPCWPYYVHVGNNIGRTVKTYYPPPPPLSAVWRNTDWR